MTHSDNLYSPQEIVSSIENTAIANLGISPEVSAQTKRVKDTLGKLASERKVLSVQLLGSRANGTAGPQSDVDCAFIAFNDEYPNVYEMSGQVLREEGLSCDPTVARTCLGITAAVPGNAPGFAWWAESTAPFCLFNSGIKPDLGVGTLELLQLAAITVQMQDERPTRDSRWREMKDEYNLAYLGDPKRMRDKLRERVGSHAASLLTDDVILRRYRKFGMPSNIEIANKRLTEKFTSLANTGSVHPQAVALYEDVLKEVAA